jgi:hypothetical protein
LAHILIFNTHYWDRSLAALHRCAIGQVRGDLEFKAFRMPTHFDSLVEYVSTSDYESLTLVGAFREWPDNPKETSIQNYLLDLFRQSKSPRVWNICFDLHHDLWDLFYGKKTPFPKADDSIDTVNVPLRDYFDMVAWGYEYLDRSHEIPAFVMASSEEQQVWKFRHKKALSTYDAITTQIQNRMDFFHVAELNEIPFPISLLSRLKAIKVSSLGAPYPVRVHIRRLISQLYRTYFLVNFFIYASNFMEKLLNKLIRILTRRNYNNFSFKSYLEFSKQTLVTTLSAYSWVDGSSLNYPVRKYLEVPLCNSVLLSPPSSAVEAMGYVDKESILFVGIPEEPTQLKERLKISRSGRKRIRSNAKGVVARLHSPEARLSQLQEFIANFDVDFQVRTKIQQGEFKVLKKTNTY